MKPKASSVADSTSSRRIFLQRTAVFASVVAAGNAMLPALARAAAKPPALSIADLPNGSAPAALSFPHFPDRLHAFVWRNWTLVPASQMAGTVGASTTDILRMGKAMGLGRQRITRDQQARSYITVIKRNWHLLPYDQLLELLGWTPDQMAYTLREDDFLFVKLGNLKPKCERLLYQPPNAVALQREHEIAAMIQENFPAGVCGGAPHFSFVADLSRNAAVKPCRADGSHLKFCYSYFALYGDPLLETQADPYPDGYLARLAEAGVSGVWLQAVLYKLAPFPWDPALSAHFEERLKNLKRLVNRASRHGIKVFLYLNEPRSMPLRFFEQHPELKGVTEGDYASLCTSLPDVQQFVIRSVEKICRTVPQLGGFFSITASENFTNCWSHGGGANCPKCGKRSPAEVIAEVNTLFFKGIAASRTDARLIAWDWGWDDGWAPDAIRRLPPGVSFMSVSEWRLPINRGGIRTEVGEYSISAVGPGPRAQAHWQVARERGLKTIAKIQAGNTWELSAVPYIPAVENVARHGENLQRIGITDLMLGWTLGGCPSPNLEVASEALATGSAERAMQQVADRRFGPALAPAIIAAWRGFSAAFSEFPYHGGVVYSGPQQLGPANLFWAKPTGYRASMVGFPYDDLDSWRAVYPPEIFVQQLEKVATGFEKALYQLRKSAASVRTGITPAQYHALQSECGVAEAAAIHFRSSANQARFVIGRKAAADAATAEERNQQATIMRDILRQEIALAQRLHAIQCFDSRIGFEASNHYFYVPVDLAEKVLNCHQLLREVGTA